MFYEKYQKKILAMIISVMLIGGNTVFASDVYEVDAIQAEAEQADIFPLRQIAENDGYAVEWNETDRSICLVNQDRKILLRIGSDIVEMDGNQIQTAYEPQLLNDKTYLPIDFFDIFSDLFFLKSDSGQFKVIKRELSDKENMMNMVAEISKYPRSPQDETHQAAMDYVISKFYEYGYEVKKQEFHYSGMNWETGEKQDITGANLIAVKKADLNPTGDALIIGAHYDGAEGVPAANDNGSGVSVMLELARILKDLPSDTEIRFVAFDAEEEGCEGSKAYVKALEGSRNVIGMLNFDMLAGAKAKNSIISTGNNTENFMFQILQNNLNFYGLELQPKPSGLSDHFAFNTAAIPTVDFSHDSIKGEYHSDNDSVENMSADMLESCAEAGYAIVSKIMSNLTPSYKTIARPEENEAWAEIRSDQYVPVSGTVESISRRLNGELIQIPSVDSMPKYQIKVKLFGLESPLELVYDGQSASRLALNPSIDLLKGGISFETIKPVMDELFGNGKEMESPKENTTLYVYHAIYGNRWELCYTNAPDHQELTLSILNYVDDNQEAYQIENGELIRMDKDDLMIDCEITKQNGSFNVTIKEAKADKNLPISENARMSWEKVKTFLSDEEMDQMDYVIFRTDGLGLEKPLKVIDDGSVAAGRNETIVLEEYKDYPRDVQMIIKDAMESLEDGETYRQSEDMKGKKLIIDYLDVLNEKGTAYTDIDLVHAAALMKFDGEIAKEQIDQTAKFPEGATSFEKNTYFYDKNSITYQFADQFYREIYSYYTDLPYSFDFYSRYPNEFVCEEAAKDIMSDMAYSFAEFVIRDGVVNLGGVMGQKIEFFNDFPEYVKIREELRKKIMS